MHLPQVRVGVQAVKLKLAPPPSNAVCQIDETLIPFCVPIASIRPDSLNERTHSRENLDAIKASLQAFKQREPLVVNSRTGKIEAGHGRHTAMVEMGWTHCAVVLVSDTDKAASGYRIVANRSSELGEWDLSKLTASLKELSQDEIAAAGFTPKQIESMEKLMAPAKPPDQFPIMSLDIKTDFKCPQCGYEWSGKSSFKKEIK